MQLFGNLLTHYHYERAQFRVQSTDQKYEVQVPDRDRDTLFLLLAAHEIRQPSRRTEFFLESARVLADSGQLLLVEHLRDWRNFAAFGPGFLHFHSRDEWLRLARDAGLTVEREDRISPFVHYFLMTKAAA